MKQSEIAKGIAYHAHKGQKRKGIGDGTQKDYICHPEAVAHQMDIDDLKAIAWLHDTIEDTRNSAKPVTEGVLRRNGINEQVIWAVKALTRKEGENYFEFIQRCAQNPLAVPVKLADLRDNMKDLNEGSLKDKYRFAQWYLENHSGIRS